MSLSLSFPVKQKDIKGRPIEANEKTNEKTNLLKLRGIKGKYKMSVQYKGRLRERE